VKKLSIIAALIFFQTLVYGDNISQRFIAAADKAGKAVVSIQVFVVEKGHYQKVGYASGTIISSRGLWLPITMWLQKAQYIRLIYVMELNVMWSHLLMAVYSKLMKKPI
jgi:membrane associated rhomboid family serine protease